VKFVPEAIESLFQG